MRTDVDFRIVQEIGASPAAVDEALVDPEFLGRMAELPKLGSAEVLSQSRDGDVVRQQVRYLFQADLSPAITAVVDPKLLTWVEDAACDLAAHRTTCTIEPDHYANMLVASYEAGLEAAGNATRRTITGRLKVHVPLVGGKVERVIVSGLEENAAAQADLLATWIADH